MDIYAIQGVILEGVDPQQETVPLPTSIQKPQNIPQHQLPRRL